MGMWKPNAWCVRQGEEAKVLLHVLDASGAVMNISGANAVSVRLKNQDGTFTTKAVDQGIAWGTFNPIWVYGLTFTAEETAKLPVRADQSIDVMIGFGEKVFHNLLPKVMTVLGPVDL
jgi:hypothetical protein